MTAFVAPTYPRKRPHSGRDLAWAQYKAAEFAEYAVDAAQTTPEYWLDWLAACRRDGLGQAGMRHCERLIRPQLSDTHALDLIAAEMSGSEWSPDTLEVIAVFVRATGRSIEEPFEVDDEEEEDAA